MNHYILIWSICTFVETRVQEEIHLEDLARQTGFSLAHIRDVFRKYTGNCPAICRSEKSPMRRKSSYVRTKKLSI